MKAAGKLSQLGGIVGGEITKRDATVVAIETSISSIERLKIVTEDASKNSLALLEAQHKENLERLDKQIKELENQYEASVFYLDGLLQKAEDQLNIAFGTYTAILSVSSALSSYNTILLSYIDAISSDTAQQVNKVQTISTSNVAQTGANINSSNVAEEIKQLREELAAQNRAIAQNTLATAKILAQWDGDGQPETRVV
jgi:nitrate reductase NapAB chaperone NapD